VRIKPECRDKFGGHEHVAAAMKRLSISPCKKDGKIRDMMEHLLKDKQMREIMFTNATKEAIKFIKNS